MVEVGDEALFVADGGVGCGGVVILYILWRNDIRCVSVGKDEVHFSLAVEVDTRLDRGDEVAIGQVGDRVVVEHIAHRQVHVRGIYRRQGVCNASPRG